MIVLRRIALLFALLIVPAALAGLLYEATLYGLTATNRTVEPNVLHYSLVIEYAAFLFVMILEVRSRW